MNLLLGSISPDLFYPDRPPLRLEIFSLAMTFMEQGGDISAYLYPSTNDTLSSP